MLIAEDLLLLLTKDNGKPESVSYAGYGYAAANLTELVLAERISIGDEKDPRVRVTDASPLGCPVLDPVLERVRDKDGAKLSALVADGRLSRESEVAAGLQIAGVLRVEPKKMFGLLPARRQVIDPAPGRCLRERLRVVLTGGGATPREASLLAILQGLGAASKALKDEAGGLGRKELKKRIEVVSADIAVDDAISKAVGRAVAAVNTAVITAAVIPVVVSSGS